VTRIFVGRRSLIAHSIIPIEVPVISETKRLWGIGRSADAIRFAYLHALDDLQRAFHTEFSPTWTQEEIQVHGMRPEMGRLPDFLQLLYRLYEPVRFGGRVPATGNPVELLQSIYAHAEMWQLYAPGLVARPAREALPPLDETRLPPARAA
jgi:hypothetical protein